MELSNILLPSHSVEVTVSVRDENMKATDLILRTIIEKGYKDGVFKIVAPIYHGKVYNFHIDEYLLITFASPEPSNKDQYSVKCRVVDRHFAHNLSTLTLMVAGTPVKIQRRQSFRVNIYNTYNFTFRNSNYELISKDISSSGMLALSTVQLPKNTIIDIIFDANPKPKEDLDSDYQDYKVFRIRCKILDSMPQVEIRRYLNRIQFEGLTETESQFLIQYLYAKQTEILHLNPEISQKITNYFEHEDDNFIDITSSDYRRLQILGLLGTIGIFIAFVMLLFSRPKKMYVLDYFFDFYRPQFWRTDYLLGALIVATIIILVDLIGLALNVREIRKNNSTIHWPLLLTLMIALSILIFVYIVTSINQLPLF